MRSHSSKRADRLRRYRHLALSTAGVTALIGASLSAAPASGSPLRSAQLVSDPAALVNPLVGTGSGGATVGQVDTFPGASMPFGMIQWSPDTTSRPAGGGYNYADSAISGFSLTHLSGPGCAVAGDFPILPLVGSVPSNPTSATDTFSHQDESAHPGSYSVTLDPGTSDAVASSLAVTDRTGLGSFTFPSSSASHLLFKVADSASGGSGATFRRVGADEVIGSVSSGHFCGQPNTYSIYFAATFNRPIKSVGTWGKGGSPVQGGDVTFDTTGQHTVKMKTAISYVSTKGMTAI